MHKCINVTCQMSVNVRDEKKKRGKCGRQKLLEKNTKNIKNKMWPSQINLNKESHFELEIKKLRKQDR